MTKFRVSAFSKDVGKHERIPRIAQERPGTLAIQLNTFFAMMWSFIPYFLIYKSVRFSDRFNLLRFLVDGIIIPLYWCSVQGLGILLTRTIDAPAPGPNDFLVTTATTRFRLLLD